MRFSDNKNRLGSSDSPDSLRVLVFAPLYPPAFRGGGPIRSIAALISSAPDGSRPAVLTSDRDLGVDEALPVRSNSWSSHAGADVYYATVTSPLEFWKALLAVRRFRPTLLHFNSFMNPRLTALPLVLWRVGFWRGAAILLSPRGEFGASALGRRSLKKRVYLAFFRMLRLDRSVIWHSTAPHETEDIRKIWGDRAVIIERENDTELATQAKTPVAIDGPLRAVFLGRIVEHKGLAVALEGLAGVSSPVRFDIYGSREDQEYALLCESLAAALPANIIVSFRGPIVPSDVITVLGTYEVLLMPTAGENFGHVIAEALSASCMVAVTPHTPWSDVLSAGGGVVIERSPALWSDGIQRLASGTGSDRLARRRAAGKVYEAWSGRPRNPHLWKLAVDVISTAAQETK